jgi:dephospho-CoA kinase
LGSRLQLSGLTGKYCYTGGISCGKTTVSNLFRAIDDIGVIDADEISREVMKVTKDWK